MPLPMPMPTAIAPSGVDDRRTEHMGRGERHESGSGHMQSDEGKGKPDDEHRKGEMLLDGGQAGGRRWRGVIERHVRKITGSERRDHEQNS